MVNIVIGLGLVLFMVGVNGWLSLYLLMMMIPLVGGYLNMLSSIMSGIGLNESLKKLMVLLLVLCLSGLCCELMYVLGFMVFSSGVLGTVIVGVYVFLTLNLGMWLALMLYVVLGVWIQDSYKLLGLSVLPLIVFFVKVCGSYLVMWMVMLHAMLNLL